MPNGFNRRAASLAILSLALCACAPVIRADELPVEGRAVLERFLGAWNTEATIRRLHPTELQIRTRGRGKCITTLGGRYYEFRTETIPPGESELQVMTYDANHRVFRQWVFSSDGYHHEAVGAWDPATTTLRWKGTSGDGTFVIDDRFVAPDRLEWVLTRTNGAGEVTQTINGVLRKDTSPER